MRRGGRIRRGSDLADGSFQRLGLSGIARRTAILVSVDKAGSDDLRILRVLQIRWIGDHGGRCAVRVILVEIDAHTIGQIVRRVGCRIGHGIDFVESDVVQQHRCAFILGEGAVLRAVARIGAGRRKQSQKRVKAAGALQFLQGLLKIAQAHFKAGFGGVVSLGVLFVVLIGNRLREQGGHDQCGGGEHHHDEQDGQHHGSSAFAHTLTELRAVLTVQS